MLFLVAESCVNTNLPTPAVTFDQLLYIKAYEIVSTKNIKIFVRLGVFHQLMSFLSSIGCLMEGNGLLTALECVYVQLTVGRMFSGKAYARVVRGHVLCIGRLIFTSGKFFAFSDRIPA